MKLTRISALIALVALIAGVAAAAILLLDSPSPAQTATEALRKSSATVRADLLADVSPQRPLVLTLELFQKGGYQTIEDRYITIYPERVISRTVLTPDSDGRLASATEKISTLDGQPPVRGEFLGIFSGDGPVGSTTEDAPTPPSNPSPGDQSQSADPSLGPTGHTGAESELDLAGWLNAQLQLPSVIQERGYTYAGRFSLNGQPSIRYERRSVISALPNGQVFDPPVVLLLVIEFVEANPLLGQESHYTILDSGELVLDRQTTTLSEVAEEVAGN